MSKQNENFLEKIRERGEKWNFLFWNFTSNFHFVLAVESLSSSALLQRSINVSTRRSLAPLGVLSKWKKDETIFSNEFSSF